VTQKAYNGVAILSSHPIETISTTLAGDEADSHSRFIEVMITDLRIVNIYLPNGNPVGSDNFRLQAGFDGPTSSAAADLGEKNPPTLVGGDFNVIPEGLVPGHICNRRVAGPTHSEREQHFFTLYC
jgi:exodeoxyribonuclease III